MRKLVTIETVAEVRPIADADAIEVVTIRGWTVVVKKGQFEVGDTCAYFEIDAALPLIDPRFAFLGARGTNTTVTGDKVHVLKTARLRGVYSQGLVLPLAQFPEFDPAHDDLAALVDVEKWEPPLPAALGGDMLGAFPTGLARKTDAERIQNLVEVFAELRARHEWIATEKLDGTSVTFINDNGTLRVCGRNWELADGANVHWEAARTLHVADRLAPGGVIQAEIYGEGVQGNPLKVRGRHVAVFGFYNERAAVPMADWPAWVGEIAAPRVGIDMSTYETVESLIAAVDGLKSSVAPNRLAEGVVFQTADGAEVPELDYRGCFKVISNKYLLKHS